MTDCRAMEGTAKEATGQWGRLEGLGRGLLDAKLKIRNFIEKLSHAGTKSDLYRRGDLKESLRETGNNPSDQYTSFLQISSGKNHTTTVHRAG